MPIAEELTPKVLTTVLVRCWSDSDNDVLVEIKSYSVYQAADDARNEYPGYAYYDPVRVLPGAGDLVEAGADETRAVYFRDDLARNRQPTPQAIDLRPGYRHWHPGIAEAVLNRVALGMNRWQYEKEGERARRKG